MKLSNLLFSVLFYFSFPNQTRCLNQDAWQYLIGSDLPLSEFYSRYWQQQPLHIMRNKNQHFSSLLTISHLEYMLDHSLSGFEFGENLDGRDVKLVKRVKAADNEWWTGGLAVEVINASFARTAFRRGYTLIMNKVQVRLPSLFTLSRQLTDLFGYRVQGNIYFSPARSQGFEAHFDWMESFAIQISGSKRWKFYNPLILNPSPEQKFKPLQAQFEGQHYGTLVVNAGDVLYFPSGWIHEAETTDSQSLHLTIGIEINSTFTWIGYLQTTIYLLSASSYTTSEPQLFQQLILKLATPITLTRSSCASDELANQHDCPLNSHVNSLTTDVSDNTFRRDVTWLDLLEFAIYALVWDSRANSTSWLPQIAPLRRSLILFGDELKLSVNNSPSINGMITTLLEFLTLEQCLNFSASSQKAHSLVRDLNAVFERIQESTLLSQLSNLRDFEKERVEVQLKELLEDLKVLFSPPNSVYENQLQQQAKEILSVLLTDEKRMSLALSKKFFTRNQKTGD